MVRRSAGGRSRAKKRVGVALRPSPRGRHQPRGQEEEVLQVSGGRPPPASVSIEGGHSSEPGQPGGEGSQRLLVNRQHLGVNQQRGQQEATAAKEAPQGGAVGGKRSVWQPGRVCLKGPQHRAQEGEGPQDDVEAHPPPPQQQAGDRNHPILLRHGGGGWRASGAGQPGGQNQ